MKTGDSRKEEREILMNIKVYKLDSNITIDFAAAELKKYLEKLLKIKIEIINKRNIDEINRTENQNNIIIGSLNKFSNIIKYQDFSKLEDEIWIKPINKDLVLTGSNERSVLYAVYAFLEKLGIKWIYPGEEGEVILKKDNPDLFGFNIHHKASLKNRGIVIEGAVKFSQIIDFVDWMAKKRMNHFFMQFRNSYNFYKWFDNSIDKKKTLEYDEALIREIKKRGMILERVGHGWISQSMGLEKEGWDKTEEKIPEEKKVFIAKVNGKRELWKDVAIDTQICMSNEKATEEVINCVCSYAKKHPEVDVLAFWIADQLNNLCECTRCMKHHPSDLYIRLVNRLAEKLFKVNPKMKLEVAAYANVIEAPKSEIIKNKDGNVVFIFAPITRCWIHALNDYNCRSSEPLKFWPEINQIGEIGNKEYIKFLKDWLQRFDGDNYMFEYYNWFWGCRDFISTELPEVISKDIKSYPSLGVKGIISVGTERAFWPSGIAINVFAETSWDIKKDYSIIEKEYLENAFEKDSEEVKKYIHDLYDLIVDKKDYGPVHNYKTWYDRVFPDYKNKTEILDKIITGLKDKKPWLKEKFDKCQDKAIKKRWYYFLSHLNFLNMIFEAERFIIKEKWKEALGKYKEIQKYLEDNRKIIEDVFDIFDINHLFIEPKIKKILDIENEQR